jgi:hypothetical protein
MPCNPLELIKSALRNVNVDVIELSKKIYNDQRSRENEKLRNRYQERVFTYEFYHQLRLIGIEGYKLQPEVAKGYQLLPMGNKIPDFIIHVPNSDENCAVLEFKVATNSRIKPDFQKLLDFKRQLHYVYLIEIIFGEGENLIQRKRRIEELRKVTGKQIIVIYFDVKTRSLEENEIFY